MILLTPGPASTSESVRQAVAAEPVDPRDEDFTEILASIRADLLEFAGGAGTHEVVLLAGNGVCAVEAAITSALGPRQSVYVCCNGTGAERMTRIAEAFGIENAEMPSAWEEALDAHEIAHRFWFTFSHLACVHVETTTGVLNPLQYISNIARYRTKRLIIDATNTFGGIPINLRKTPIDYLVGTADRCLQGLPGVSFVIVSHRVLEETRGHPPRSLCGDLVREHEAVAETGRGRFTPPVQIVYALRQALDELKEETIEGRAARYRDNCAALRAGMLEQGFRPLVQEEHGCELLTTYLQPTAARYDIERHAAWLLADDFAIRAPTVEAFEHTFTISTIGHVTTDDIGEFLESNARVMKGMRVRGDLYV